MEREINSKLKELDGDEMVEFLLDCLPFIFESSKDKCELDEVETGFTGVTKTNVSKKGDIYKRFMRKVYDKCVDSEPINVYSCSHCASMNVVFIHDTSEKICQDCYITDQFELNHQMGFKEEQDIERTIVYSYKRENHFNEWMCQFQAKESTSVPQTIIEEIKNELKKQKISKKVDITHTKVKEILKKLGYNKYYEHTPYITTKVNGINPPVMPQHLEDRLRIMFHQIQAPFDKFCPKDRINFLSYSYVLYKFCELLGEDEYIPCFPLLKSKEKLYKHDQIWKKITEELRWEFIPTTN
jgi:hypothetical protein